METIPAIREGQAKGDSAGADLWALVLAAGAGSRFGGDKLRALWGGATLLEAAIATAKAAPVVRVIVLTRPGEALVNDPAVRLVEVPDWAEGMGATLRTGIAALPAGCGGAYVFLGDMPRIPPAVLAPMAAAVRAGAANQRILAAAPEFEGRLGHPVLFSAALFPALAALEGDRGARSVLEGLGDRLARVPAPDDGVLFDVDTPGDLNPAQG